MSLSTLSNNSSINNAKCHYNKPEEWVNWSHQFRLRAQTLNLWQFFGTDGEEWPEKPQPPLIRQYSAKQPPQSGASTSKGKGKTPVIPGLSTRSTIRGRDTPEEEEEESDQEEAGLSYPKPPSHPQELTTEERSRYQYDWTVFTYLAKEYKEHQSAVKELTTWTLSTVSYTLQQTCCIEQQGLDIWYQNLQQTGIVYEENLLPDARERYQKAVVALTKLPKSFENWITEWEISMAEGTKLGVSDTTLAIHWAPDLAKALKQIMNIWATNFVTLNKDKINKNRLNFREVAGDLRRHWKIMQPTKASIISKGAFPTFGENDQIEEEPEESKDKDKGDKGKNQGKGKKSKRQKQQKRKRQEESDSDSEPQTRQVCEACFCRHKLENCFYIFPNSAPKDWKPFKTFKRMVENRQKEDQGLIRKIKQIKEKAEKESKKELEDS